MTFSDKEKLKEFLTPEPTGNSLGWYLREIGSLGTHLLNL